MGWFNWIKVRPKGQPFSPRPDLSGEKTTSIPAGQEDIEVDVGAFDFESNVLGRTEVRKTRLCMDMDIEMEKPFDAANADKKAKQRLQTWMHEMMHVVLWKRTDITHSLDPKSILYYKVTGENLVPTQIDLEIMKDAAKKVDQIRLIRTPSLNDYPNIYQSLVGAVATWNSYIGKKLFFIV